MVKNINKILVLFKAPGYTLTPKLNSTITNMNRKQARTMIEYEYFTNTI